MKVKTTLLLIVLALSVGCTSKKGIIKLASEPSGAEVYVGGSKVGETPTNFYYDYRYSKTLTIKKDGYRTQSEALGELWIINEHKKGHYAETKKMMDGKTRKVWTVTTFRTLDKLSKVGYHTPAKSTPDYKESRKDTHQSTTKSQPKPPLPEIVEAPCLGVRFRYESAEKFKVAKFSKCHAKHQSPGDKPTVRSAAEKAGIRKGDIIVAINQIPTTSVTAFGAQVRVRRPGDTIQVTVKRDNKKLDFDVELGLSYQTQRSYDFRPLLDAVADIVLEKNQ